MIFLLASSLSKIGIDTKTIAQKIVKKDFLIFRFAPSNRNLLNSQALIADISKITSITKKKR